MDSPAYQRNLTQPNGSRSSTELKTEINRVRGYLDSTLHELGARLQPGAMVTELMDYLKHEGGKIDWDQGRQKARQASRAAVNFIEENPIPVLLIGAGIAWLIYDAQAGEEEYSNAMESQLAEGLSVSEFGLPTHYSESGSSSEPGLMAKAQEKGAELKDAIADKARDIKEAASQGTEAISQKMSAATQQVKQKSSRMGAALKQGMRSQYYRAQDQIRRSTDEHPLATGLGFLAIGALAALMLPPTSKEDEWMGSASSTLKEKTKDMGQELVDKGKDALQAGYEAAKEQIQSSDSTAPASSVEASPVSGSNLAPSETGIEQSL